MSNHLFFSISIFFFLAVFLQANAGLPRCLTDIKLALRKKTQLPPPPSTPATPGRVQIRAELHQRLLLLFATSQQGCVEARQNGNFWAVFHVSTLNQCVPVRKQDSCVDERKLVFKLPQRGSIGCTLDWLEHSGLSFERGHVLCLFFIFCISPRVSVKALVPILSL